MGLGFHCFNETSAECSIPHGFPLQTSVIYKELLYNINFQIGSNIEQQQIKSSWSDANIKPALNGPCSSHPMLGIQGHLRGVWGCVEFLLNCTCVSPQLRLSSSHGDNTRERSEVEKPSVTPRKRHVKRCPFLMTAAGDPAVISTWSDWAAIVSGKFSPQVISYRCCVLRSSYGTAEVY